jgi:membrane-associated phospholipid phosphatase
LWTRFVHAVVGREIVNRREREAEAAATLRECRKALAARGSTIIREATSASAGDIGTEIADGRHYPEGEVYDPVSHTQYFYHRHPGPVRNRPAPAIEHGHFHLFLRGEGMPAGITPLLPPELAVANAPAPSQSAPLKLGRSDEVCHLVALAVDGRGEPLRLFTTNRWVTGETWYRADDVIRMLDRFRLRSDRPSALLNRWIDAIVRLYQPEIAGLLRERDQAIVEQRWRWRGNVLEDPRLEITSSLEIDLDARLAASDACRGWPRAGAAERSRGRYANAGSATARAFHLQSILRFVSDFGDTAVTVPLALLMVGFLLAAKQPGLAVAWGLAIVGCAGAIGALKMMLVACGHSLGGPGLSSPSGHAAMSTAVYGGFAAVIGTSLARPARWAVIAGAAVLVVVIAVSRVILGAHSPVEVAIGFVVGSAALGVILAAVVRYRPAWQPVVWLAALALVVAMVFHGWRWPAEHAVRHLAGWLGFLWYWCS